MVTSIFLHPTKAFEEGFHNPNVESAVIVVVLTALFMALAVYFTMHNLFASVFMFAVNIIQWIIYSALVWFFEFVHVRKRKRMVGADFGQVLSVVGKLWIINLVASFLFLFISLVLPNLGRGLLMVVGPLILVLLIVVTLSWFVASFKMLKVVFGADRLKLVINWIILNFLNGVVVSFVTTFLARLFF